MRRILPIILTIMVASLLSLSFSWQLMTREMTTMTKFHDFDEPFDELQGCNYSSSSSEMIHYFNESDFILLEQELVLKRTKSFVPLLGDYEDYQEYGDYFFYSPGTLPDTIPGGVAIFRNAFLQGNPPMVFDCSSVYLPGSCKWEKATTKASFDINQTIEDMEFNKIIHLDTAIMIYQFWGYAYYHAMVEDLPRLAYVVDFLKAHPNAVILAGSWFSRRSVMINQVLGLTNQTWIPYNTARSYFVKNLLVPTGTHCGRAQPKPVEAFQSQVDHFVSHHFPYSDTDLKHGQERLILVQKRLHSRKVQNHAMLVATLQQQFPTSHVKEFYGNESFINTLLLHHAADIIVGPHGAGLANLIFSRRGQCGVVEMHPSYGNYNGTDINQCHQYTAKAAGLESRLVVQTDGSNFGDISVNITAVLEAVLELLPHLGKGPYPQ